MAASMNNRAEEAEEKLRDAEESLEESIQRQANDKIQIAQLKAMCDELKAANEGSGDLIRSLEEKSEQNEALINQGQKMMVKQQKLEGIVKKLRGQEHDSQEELESQREARASLEGRLP